jgi:hypothetical protein
VCLLPQSWPRQWPWTARLSQPGVIRGHAGWATRIKRQGVAHDKEEGPEKEIEGLLSLVPVIVRFNVAALGR